MTNRGIWRTNNDALIDYLKEQRRHCLALAKAAERLIVELEPKMCYNQDTVESDGDNVTKVEVEYIID